MNALLFAVEELKAGRSVTVALRGNSMTPLVESGQKVTLDPSVWEELNIDDIVLCKVKGRIYLHKIVSIRGDQFLIGNNHGGINGWVGSHAIYGKKR